MMSLSVSMALSGLGEDHWTDDLRDLYNHGLSVIESDLSPSASSISSIATATSSLSCCSSVSSESATSTSSASASTQESGIDSLSPKSQYLEASSCQSTHPCNAILLLKSSGDDKQFCDSNNNSKWESTNENSSSANETDMRNMKKTDDEHSNSKKNNREESRLQSHHKQPVIIYNGRDILDLGANLRNSWRPSYTILAGGVSSFFENRSQHSRIAGCEPPPFCTMICEQVDCGFREQHYY